MASSPKDYLTYYKQKIDRTDENNHPMLLEIISKLSRPAVTSVLLQETGIYKSVYKLSKRKGEIGKNALILCNKWKFMMSLGCHSKEKASSKNFSPLVETRHPSTANHSSKPRPDSSKTREADPKYHDHKQLPTWSVQLVADPTQDKHSSFRSRDSNSDLASKNHPRAHLASGSETTRVGSSSHRGSRQRDISAPGTKPPSHPSHRSSDSDSDKSSKLRPTRRDYFPPGDEMDFFFNHCPQTVQEQSETDSRLTLFTTDDLFALQRSAIRNSGDPEGGSEQKDHFATDADPTQPSSSELNNVCCSQDSNNTDIDSLSNPNLNIDGSQAASSSADSSPSKKIFEPYYIEMKEGMFRAVKHQNNAFTNSSKLFFEVIHREIIKGNGYRREKDKYDEQKYSEPLPKDLLGDLEKPEPVDQKPNSAKSKCNTSGSSKHDLKRKSSSPCSRGSDKRPRLERDSDHKAAEKRLCPDSTSDQKLKIKKEEKSPSQVYKPANNAHAHQSNCDRNKNSKLKDSPEDAAMEFISSKKERRSIYSGKKCVQDVSSLQTFCQRFLKKNLDCIRGPKKVPYEVLHPILEALNPAQLSKVEDQNPYLFPHTNGLWKLHCNRDYRGMRILKNEKDVIWKHEYNRAYDQQSKKLKNLTASINAAASKSKPDRQAKLTLVDTTHDPLRRRSKAVEVPIVSLKPTNFSAGHKSSSPVTYQRSTSPAVTSKSSLSPIPKPSSVTKPSMPVIIIKQKETKHPVAHKPVKKVVAPLMSKVKKSMGFAFRQK